MQNVTCVQPITVRRARSADAQEIEALLRAEDLDQQAFVVEDFLVAEAPAGRFAGCARLKPYRDCVELSSVAVHPGCRGQGVGSMIVATLLCHAEVPAIYVLCEPKETAFFVRFGFQELCREDMPLSLMPKLLAYETKVGSMVTMKRER